MSERTALTKTSETKGKFPSTKPKENLYQSMDSPVEEILHLQQTMGNQAVQRLIKSRTIQAKLKIGKPNDKYEQEADRIADQIIQRQVEPKEEGEITPDSEPPADTSFYDNDTIHDKNDTIFNPKGIKLDLDSLTTKHDTTEEDTLKGEPEFVLHDIEFEEELDEEEIQENDFSIGSSVGEGGKSECKDVITIQDKLLGIGLLSQENYITEYPKDCKTECPEDSITIVDEKKLECTIETTYKFQELMNPKNWKPDGLLNTSTSPTMEKLKQIKSPGDMVDLKKKYNEAKQAEKRAEEAEAMKKKEFKDNKDLLLRLWKKYVSSSYYWPWPFTKISVNTEGLGRDIKPIVIKEPNLVMILFKHIPYRKKDDLAYEIARNLNDEELKNVDTELLEYMRDEMIDGWTVGEEYSQIDRIIEIIGIPEEVNSDKSEIQSGKNGYIYDPILKPEDFVSQAPPSDRDNGIKGLTDDELFSDALAKYRNNLGDHTKEWVYWRACKNACTVMLNNKGLNEEIFRYDIFDENKSNDYQKAIKLLDNNLKAKKPVMSVVDAYSVKKKSSKDHFILINAKGEDENGTFYQFFDPGSGRKAGYSPNNKLYIGINIEGNEDDFTISGGTEYTEDRKYTLKQVRYYRE